MMARLRLFIRWVAAAELLSLACPLSDAVETQQQHLSEMDSSDRTIIHAFSSLVTQTESDAQAPSQHSAVNPTRDPGSAIERNLQRQKNLIQLGEIHSKHLAQLAEIYKRKMYVIESEIKNRKRQGREDGKSRLGKEVVGGVCVLVCFFVCVCVLACVCAYCPGLHAY